MSNQVNTELLERAAEMVGYFEGKLPATLIQKALDSNDLEQAHYYVGQAEAMAAEQEMHGYNVLPKGGEV